ncbi:MAG: zinc ribbon domain-containing protein [Nanoarchaeota archaeon]|nr:zinc ribbon domain-containing protein [Nanoarchaeota archaeon]
MRAAGGFWSKIFDIQNKKFQSISCTNCGYTEFYKKGKKSGENIIDFLTR